MIDKKALKKEDIFKPDEWALDSLPKGIFDRQWLKKINLNKPGVKRNILLAIIAAVTALGVIKRREVKKQIEAVLQTYKKRNQEIEEAITQSKSRGEKIGELTDDKKLKQIIENNLVYSAGVVSYEAHKGQRFRWLLSEAEDKDPYHRSLAGGIYRYGFKDKNGHDLGYNRRWGCQCGIEWIDDKDKK